MGGIINRLSELLANQIAAGEVVQSPSSVTKELLENSIDAGSTYVILSIKEGGKKSMQVIDDGKGMSNEDAAIAFERHATSKIATIDDLFNIRTFGFRGEALSSISSVAEVELTTRRDEDELGTHIMINGGTLVTNELVSFATSGSQFIVKNLFYNVPARKKSLKKDITETKRIVQEFQRVALCHSKVAFSLYVDDKLLHMLSSTINMRQRITALMGKTIGNSILDLYVDTTMVEIKGYIGKPNIAKRRPECFFFVNGRYFESPYLHKAVQNGYEKLVPEGMTPPYYLHLTLNPQNVDVNITPTKTSVKFDEESAIWQIINAAVRESLGKNGIIPMIDFNNSYEVSDVDIYKPDSTPTQQKRVDDSRDDLMNIDIFNDNKDIDIVNYSRGSNGDASYARSEFNPFDDSFSFTTALSGQKDSFKDSYSSYNEEVLNSDKAESYKSSDSTMSDFESAAFDSRSFESGSSESTTFDSVTFNSNHSESTPADTTVFNTTPLDTASLDTATLGTASLGTQSSNQPFNTATKAEYEDVEYDSTAFQSQIFETESFEVTDAFVLNKQYGIANINGNINIFDISRMLYVITFYRFLNRIENKESNVGIQKLLFPIEISLSVTDKHVLEEHKEHLRSIGFLYEDDTESELVLFNGIPADLEVSDTNWFIEEVLTSLKYSDAVDAQTSLNEQLAISGAKTVSRRKSGDTTTEEFKYLIDTLFKAPAYNFTYDGRRVFVKITTEQIASFLK